MVKKMYQNRFMIRKMVRRDIKRRYAGSILGILWSVVHPLTQIAIYYFVFSVVLDVGPGPEYGEANFAIWLIAGLLPWMFFVEIVTRAPAAVLDHANVIRKMVFPSEVLPLVHVVSAVIHHLIAVAVFVIALVAALSM